MTKQKKGLEAIAPPPKRQPKGGAKFTAPADSAKVQFNVRITNDRAVFVKMLAAKLGRQPGEMVEEALDLLEKEYGAI